MLYKSILIKIIFFCNLIKIPFLGVSLLYFWTFFIIPNTKDLKKIFIRILLPLSFFIFIQKSLNSTAYIETFNVKHLIILFSGLCFGVFFFKQNKRLNLNSLYYLCYIFIFLFVLTYFFRTLDLFQYARFREFGNSFVKLGLIPLYLKTNKITYSPLASDPNQIVSGIFLFYILFCDKIKIKHLLPIFTLSLICDAKYISINIILTCIYVFLSLDKSRLKRVITIFLILFSVFLLSKGFDNPRYVIWSGYLNSFLADGFTLFGYNSDKIIALDILFRAPHNTILDLYLYTGLIGTLIFFILIYNYCKNKDQILLRYLCILLSISGISFFMQPIFYALIAIISFDINNRRIQAF